MSSEICKLPSPINRFEEMRNGTANSENNHLYTESSSPAADPNLSSPFSCSTSPPPLLAIYRSGALVGVGALYTLSLDTFAPEQSAAAGGAPVTVPYENVERDGEVCEARPSGFSVTVLGTSHHALPPDALTRADTELCPLHGLDAGVVANIGSTTQSQSSSSQKSKLREKRLRLEQQSALLGFHFEDYVLDVSLLELTSEGLEAVHQLLSPPWQPHNEQSQLIPYRIPFSTSSTASVPSPDLCLMTSSGHSSKHGIEGMAAQFVRLERLENPYLTYKSSSDLTDETRRTQLGTSGTPVLSCDSCATTLTAPTLTQNAISGTPVAIHNGRFVQETLHGLLPCDSPLRRRGTLWSHVVPLFWRERTRTRLSRWCLTFDIHIFYYEFYK